MKNVETKIKATEAYDLKVLEVNKLMAEIKQGLERHLTMQTDDKKNWEFVGDMERVISDLSNVVAYLPKVGV